MNAIPDPDSRKQKSGIITGPTSHQGEDHLCEKTAADGNSKGDEEKKKVIRISGAN